MSGFDCPHCGRDRNPCYDLGTMRARGNAGEAACLAAANREASVQKGSASISATHILPDANAPRHSWNFVKRVAAKARAAAWKEAADVARTYAVIAGTTRQEQVASADCLAQEFAKLARTAEQEAATVSQETASPAPADRSEGGRNV